MNRKNVLAIMLALLVALIPLSVYAGGEQEDGDEQGTEAAESARQTGGIKVWFTLEEYEAEEGVLEQMSQSPYLADQDLPPVEERVGLEPVVIRPYEEVGTYGGTARVWTKRPSPTEDGVGFISHEGLLRVHHDDATFVPNVAKSFEWSNGGRTITFELRQGMKWSDGDDFDTEDIRFWWEDVVLNDELTPVKPGWLKTGGELATVEIIDDVTFSVTFTQPYPTFLNRVGHYSGVTMLIPSHYLKQFHAKYNESVAELVEEEGYETWVQLYSDKSQIYQGSVRTNHEENVPTLYNYVMTQQESDFWVFERNPYYWKVDSTGQQLPYIDRVVVSLASNVELIDAKIISGEADFAAFNTGLANYTIYRENEEQGGYDTYLWAVPFGAFPVLQFNLSYQEDPVLTEIFNDVRFRRAMSVALNRDEMNEGLFFGRAVPRQNTVIRSSKFFLPEFEEAYAQYDVEMANQLLDEMGLEWDANRKWRLRPDGEQLTVIMEYTNIDASGAIESLLEMVQNYWAEVGVNLQLKQQAGEILVERVEGNQVQAGMWTGDKVTDVLFPIAPDWFVPYNVTWGSSWEPGWGQWYVTDGAEGVEPPPEAKLQLDRWEALKTAVDIDEQIEYGRQILRSQADNLWTIGTVGLPPSPIIVKDNLMNVPEEGIKAWDNFWGMSYYPEQRFFKRPLLPSQQ